jgi:hypothetical protein
MLAALAAGTVISFGMLQAATEKKYKEFRESLKRSEDLCQEIGDIQSECTSRLERYIILASLV